MTNINYTNLYNYIRVVFHYTRIIYLRANFPEPGSTRERGYSTLKNLINKVASDNPKSWHKHLGFVLWAIRETPNATTTVPPALLAWGRVPRGPLAILKDTMTGKVELPLNLGKTASEYLQKLIRNIEKAQDYATTHTEKAQQRYISRYNMRAREKSFEIGQKVLVLIPD